DKQVARVDGRPGEGVFASTVGSDAPVELACLVTFDARVGKRCASGIRDFLEHGDRQRSFDYIRLARQFAVMSVGRGVTHRVHRVLEVPKPNEVRFVARQFLKHSLADLFRGALSLPDAKRDELPCQTWYIWVWVRLAAE